MYMYTAYIYIYIFIYLFRKHIDSIDRVCRRCRDIACVTGATSFVDVNIILSWDDPPKKYIQTSNLSGMRGIKPTIMRTQWDIT